MKEILLSMVVMQNGQIQLIERKDLMIKVFSSLGPGSVAEKKVHALGLLSCRVAQTEAWEEIKDIWYAISAKVDPSNGKPLEGAEPGKPVTGGVPCTSYIGTDGSGHYVKMVHNGIEYGDMQMICEAYHILSEIGGLEPYAIGEIF